MVVERNTQHWIDCRYDANLYTNPGTTQANDLSREFNATPFKIDYDNELIKNLPPTVHN